MAAPGMYAANWGAERWHAGSSWPSEIEASREPAAVPATAWTAPAGRAFTAPWKARWSLPIPSLPYRIITAMTSRPGKRGDARWRHGRGAGNIKGMKGEGRRNPLVVMMRQPRRALVALGGRT